MQKYKIIFKDDFDEKQKSEIEEVVSRELDLLLKFHDEIDIEMEFYKIYRENKYVKFSAASDEPKKMWFEINMYCDFETIIKHLPETIAHEFHHMIRHSYDFDWCLAELFVSEGLAVHFTMEVKGSPLPGFIRKINDNIMHNIRPIINQNLFKPKFNHRDWQRGNPEIGIPQSFCYSFGYQIVRDYLEANPDKRASNLFNVNSKEILKNYFIV